MVKRGWLEGGFRKGLESTAAERESIVMVSAMGIEKHAAFYRGYQPDQRSLFPVAIILATLVAVWVLIYLVSAVGPAPAPAMAHAPAQAAYVAAPAASR